MLLVFKELLLMPLKWSPAFTLHSRGVTNVLYQIIFPDMFYVEPSLANPHSVSHYYLSCEYIQ